MLVDSGLGSSHRSSFTVNPAFLMQSAIVCGLKSPKMPGDIVNWTPGLACEVTLGFHEVLDKATGIGGSEKKNTPGLQDAPGFTKFGDRIGDVFNNIIERHGRKTSVGKMARFEAAVRDFKSKKTSNVKVRVIVGFDTDDGKTAGVGVLEEKPTETADIEQRPALTTIECQMVEKPFVLRLFPGRWRARVKKVRIRAISNESAAVIERYQFLFGGPLGGEEHSAAGTFVNAQIVVPPDGSRRIWHRKSDKPSAGQIGSQNHTAGSLQK